MCGMRVGGQEVGREKVIMRGGMVSELRELRLCDRGKRKKRKKIKRVMQPTACQCCPLEMINGCRL